MKHVDGKMNTLEALTEKIMKQDTTTKQDSTNADDDKSSSLWLISYNLMFHNLVLKP